MSLAVSRLMSGQAREKISVPWTVPITCRHRALNSGPQQQPVEANSLVPQGITLIDADDRGRKARHIRLGGEPGPGQGIAAFERLDAIGHGATVVVQFQENAVVFSG